MADKGAEQTCDAKLVLLGNSGVGKTSVVLRYVQGVYSLDQPSTIGASFMTKRMFLDDWKVKLQIWDTAGQERFRSMTPMYYRGASAAILVYDITSVESFECVKDWVVELRTQVQHDIVLAIAGNKKDLEEQRQVKLAKAQEYAESVGAIIYETSAKDNEGIEELFVDVSRRLIEMNAKKDKSPMDNDKIKRLGEKPSGNGGCPC
mmetsp:Transcript_3845/g.6234  ORF Transcript_3845/g.6234 Transcript_3845/m.6234 type:complete len:205 (-) Transcript_3845:42-656(-)|eukprot:CAMPEP_0168583694 /NCGR_PEP_ID=MMETSP0420-20121227/2717_1 /TAXON_ID=498008 /ORGANISM="Pessonella sp." /LENGTH=204 /DNA_ID=CAMNT_0008618395 /DNA_START=54 /DNA_END=668 /DNA_ORIENTATION=+